MNSIGERIYELRKQNNLSQGDLAEKLDVSRQTISKWENNSSLPELEKIIALSEIFSVTTDFIIKGATATDSAEETELTQANTGIAEEVVAEVSNNKSLSGKTLSGLVLIVIGSILFAVFCFTAQVLAMLAAWIIGVGVLLILCRKRLGLCLSWFSFIMGERFCRYFTTVNMNLIFKDYAYNDYYLLQLILSFVLWLILCVLVIVTLVALSKGRKKA